MAENPQQSDKAEAGKPKKPPGMRKLQRLLKKVIQAPPMRKP